MRERLGSTKYVPVSSHPVRREKEPDKFYGRTVEWKDFLVLYERV